jgi:hypothetical protein
LTFQSDLTHIVSKAVCGRPDFLPEKLAGNEWEGEGGLAAFEF